MPNTGDATGSFDAGRAAQTIYRCFQDNGVPILGLCRTTVEPGPPPTVHIDVNLADGVPVATDPNALPEGDTLPASNGQLSIDLTQFNNSVGGFSWVASGTVTRSNGDTVTATSTPGTGGLTSMDLNDPDKRDEWNRSLPQDAYDAIERVKRKLGIRGGRVASAAPRPSRRRIPRAPVTVAGSVIGLLLGGGIGLALGTAPAEPVPAEATAVAQRASPTPTPGPPLNTLQLNLQGNVTMTAVPPVCGGWPASGAYKLAVQTNGPTFTMSIDGAAPATGTIDAGGDVAASNQFYRVTGHLAGQAAGTAARAEAQLMDEAVGFYLFGFRISYLEGTGMCAYDASASFGGPTPAATATPTPTAAPTAPPTAAPGGGSRSTFPLLPAALGLAGAIVLGGGSFVGSGLVDGGEGGDGGGGGEGGEGGESPGPPPSDVASFFFGSPTNAPAPPPSNPADPIEQSTGDGSQVVQVQGDSHGEEPPETT